MSLRVSRRAAGVSPFIVMDVMRAAYEREVQGHDIVHLEVGQPSTSAPGTRPGAAIRATSVVRITASDARPTTG